MFINKNIFFLVICYLFLIQKTLAQDTIAIVSFADKILIKANFDTQNDTYLLKDYSDNSKLKISPNTNLRLFLSLDYEFIGLSFGFSPKFISSNNDTDEKGETSFSDFQIRFFFKKWVQGIQFRKIVGYYVENTGDFIPNWSNDIYLQLPDFKNTTYGMYTSYVFNSNFSYRNVLYQTEWQKESAGSFIPTLYYNYQQLSNNIDEQKSINNYYSIRVTPSYYYTFVFHKNWFVSTSLSPSLGIMFSNYKIENPDDNHTIENETYFTRFLEGGLQLGYSSSNIIFGSNLNFNANWFNESKTAHIENDKLYFLLYFGYRFNSPKFIKKPVNWVNDRL